MKNKEAQNRLSNFIKKEDDLTVLKDRIKISLRLLNSIIKHSKDNLNENVDIAKRSESISSLQDFSTRALVFDTKIKAYEEVKELFDSLLVDKK